MKPRAAVLYDGQCRLCLASVRRLRALDWLRQLQFEDARDVAVLQRHPGVDAERTLVRMQLVPAPGAPAIEGFRALRWISARVPALWVTVPFLWVLGAVGLGDRLYDFVARNRLLFGSCGAACEVKVR